MYTVPAGRAKHACPMMGKSLTPTTTQKRPAPWLPLRATVFPFRVVLTFVNSARSTAAFATSWRFQTLRVRCPLRPPSGRDLDDERSRINVRARSRAGSSAAEECRLAPRDPQGKHPPSARTRSRRSDFIEEASSQEVASRRRRLGCIICEHCPDECCTCSVAQAALLRAGSPETSDRAAIGESHFFLAPRLAHH